MADTKTECIDHGQSRSGGYGQTKWNNKFISTHRKVYAVANGLTRADIEGKLIRHTCDNKRCINPEHLLIGDHSSNAIDNALRGARHPKLKLTPEQAARVKFGGEAPAALSVALGISQTQISYIRSGKSWSHLTGGSDVS